MKKSYLCLIALLCFCSALLCACNKVEYYNISATSSEFGSVIGLPSSRLADGTEITLTAIEHDKENHPLLAWIKDNQFLVKVATEEDKTLALTVNKETAGEYTPVFDEDENSMMYAFLSNPVFEYGTEYEADKYQYQLEFVIMSNGSNNYTTFQENRIIYLGNFGLTLEYKFRVKVRYTKPSDTAETEEILVCDTIISKYNMQDVLSFSKEGSEAQFHLNLAKFSTAMIVVEEES